MGHRRSATTAPAGATRRIHAANRRRIRSAASIHACQRVYLPPARASARMSRVDKRPRRRAKAEHRIDNASTGAKPRAAAPLGRRRRVAASAERLSQRSCACSGRLRPTSGRRDRPDLQATVVLSLVLMLVAKLVTVAMPFTFKWATDALVAAAGGNVPGRRRR